MKITQDQLVKLVFQAVQGARYYGASESCSWRPKHLVWEDVADYIQAGWVRAVKEALASASSPVPQQKTESFWTDIPPGGYPKSEQQCQLIREVVDRYRSWL